MTWTHEGRPDNFRPDPKPENFDTMCKAWNDPVKFGIEVARYWAQVSEYHRARQEARR